MKTNHRRHQSRSGSALIIVLAMVFMMAIFVAANTVTVNWLRRQVKLVDQRQIQRLAGHPSRQPAPSK